jgi:hypothetical protein
MRLVAFNKDCSKELVTVCAYRLVALCCDKRPRFRERTLLCAGFSLWGQGVIPPVRRLSWRIPEKIPHCRESVCFQQPVRYFIHCAFRELLDFFSWFGYKLYYRWRMSGLPSASVGRTYSSSRRLVCCKAVAAAHCCPFRYGESLCNCYLNRLSHCQVSRTAVCVIIPMNLLLICCYYLALTDTWLEMQILQRPQCLVFVVCCIAYYISSQGHLLRIQIYWATDRALSSRLRTFVVFRCASNQNVLQAKITNHHWRIHL